jgi:hypothetical protein
MSHYDWLADLKVGDEVIDADRIIKVTAIHKRHIVCGLTKYRKTDGKDISSSGWYASWISKADDEAKAAIAEKNKRLSLLRYINNIRYSTLDVDTLSKIVAILESVEEAQ